jgi:membrane-associated HD superfamily phosphohydrolase
LYLWRRGSRLRAWEAINVILPAAFFSTLYLWSYDQILYIIPLIWIILRLIDRTHSYLAGIGFLALIVAVSFLALLSQANTRSDLLSILTTVLILAGCLTLGQREPRVGAQGATG